MSRIKWSGMKELRAKVQSNVELEQVKTIIKTNGSELQAKTMRKAPVDTGQLKRSVMLDIKDKGLTATVTPSTNYAAYVEYGTRYMNAQPYLRPAFNEQVQTLKRDLQALV